MANKTIQKFLIIGTTATTAFVAGKYYERNDQWRNYAPIQSDDFVKKERGLNKKNYPALPLFGSVSTQDKADIDNQKNYFKFPFNKLYDLAQKFGLDLDFNSVKAAAPITESRLPTSSTDIQVSKTNRVAQIMKYGFPSLDNVRSFDNYVLSYDKRNRVANWVFEHLTPESVRKNDEVDRSKCEFMPDESIHPFFRSQNTDYKKSGYDRGHLAAAGNHKCNQKQVEQTFYLTNIAPQVGKGFNRDSWNRLEKHVRKLTKTYPNVYCCTGPLYLPRREADGKLYIKYEVIGVNHVAVPTHFFKIVVGETKDGHLEMESYVMANEVIDDHVPLQNFQVPPETIERAAGLLFFSSITRKSLAKINGKNNK